MNTASAPEATGAESLRARKTLKALYGYVRPHRWAVALGLLCALAGAAGGLLQPLATKTLVDRLSSGGTIGTVPLMLTGAERRPPARRRAGALPPNGWNRPAGWRVSTAAVPPPAAADVLSTAGDHRTSAGPRGAEKRDRADECEAERR